MPLPRNLTTETVIAEAAGDDRSRLSRSVTGDPTATIH
jgi:hypothetical protein